MQYQSSVERTCQNCGAARAGGADLLCPVCKQHYASGPGTVAATWGARFGAWILDGLLAIITLGIGWLLWSLIFTYKNGQTPGKSIVGIYVVKSDGSPSTWGPTFLREFVIKGIVLWFLSNITFGIFWIINYLWPLWDRNVQALHDKMVNTLVVRGVVAVTRVQQSQPSDPWVAASTQPSSGGPAAGA